MAFFLILLLLPLVEITLFIQIGDEIGLLATLGWCLLSAVCGVAMLQYQGLRTLVSAREALQHGDLPVQEIFTGIYLYAAGVLWIIPGFATDLIGLLLCIPPVRDILQNYLAKYFVGAPVEFRTRRTWNDRNDTKTDIEVEYTHIDEDPEFIEKRLEDKRTPD
jgi:UPF0716 protein FxsA